VAEISRLRADKALGEFIGGSEEAQLLEVSGQAARPAIGERQAEGACIEGKQIRFGESPKPGRRGDRSPDSAVRDPRYRDPNHRGTKATVRWRNVEGLTEIRSQMSDVRSKRPTLNVQRPMQKNPSSSI
jgi:hypothetical protein